MTDISEKVKYLCERIEHVELRISSIDDDIKDLWSEINKNKKKEPAKKISKEEESPSRREIENGKDELYEELNKHICKLESAKERILKKMKSGSTEGLAGEIEWIMFDISNLNTSVSFLRKSIIRILFIIQNLENILGVIHGIADREKK